MADYRFIMNDQGLSGTVVYHEGDRSIEIYWEPRVTHRSNRVPEGILLYMGLREWTNPKGVKIDHEHRLKILCRLRRWLKDQNIPSNVDLAAKIETTDSQCMWRDCIGRRIKGSVFCMRHHDLNLLNALSE